MTSPSPPPLLACPACERVTPLPPQIGLGAIVRCPHCRAQFSLQDLLVEPPVAWELVSDSAPPKRLSDSDELAANYTYSDTHEPSEPVSPGAKTVEIASHQTILEPWPEDEPEEELYEPVVEVLFDSNRAVSDTAGRQALDEHADDRIESDVGDPGRKPNFVHSEYPSRKLEGPLVGEFPNETPSILTDTALGQNNHWQTTTDATTDSVSEPYEVTDKWSGYAQSSVPYLRNKRRRKSPIWSMLQIALGGIAAIPVSLLLMWHLLGTDVGGAALWVAQYAPWIVPEKWRPYDPAPADRNAPLRSASSANRTTSLTTQLEEVVLGAVDESPANESSRQIVTSDDETQLGGNERPLVNRADLENESNLDETSKTAPPDLEPSTLENCFARIRRTDKRLEEWNEARIAQREGLRSLAQSTYGELTSLAKAIDGLPKQSSVMRKVREQLQPIGRQVQQKPEVKDLIEKGANFWIRQYQLNSDTEAQVQGLAITVIVDSISHSEDGEWSEISAQSESTLGDPPPEIRIPREVAISVPQSVFEQGRGLFLLGTVLPRSQEPENSSAAAPRPQTFVASYLSPL